MRKGGESSRPTALGVVQKKKKESESVGQTYRSTESGMDPSGRSCQDRRPCGDTHRPTARLQLLPDGDYSFRWIDCQRIQTRMPTAYNRTVQGILCVNPAFNRDVNRHRVVLDCRKVCPHGVMYVGVAKNGRRNAYRVQDYTSIHLRNNLRSWLRWCVFTA